MVASTKDQAREFARLVEELEPNVRRAITRAAAAIQLSKEGI